MKSKLTLVLIVILAFCLRFLYLGEIPAGIHQDEESHGYNAYSLIKTGKDRYGEPFPILFRSFGSYQPPVYTYLAIVPVVLFGNSIAAVRSVSALAGVILVIVSYFLTKELFNVKGREQLALIAALVVAISPWSVYFSRLVAEGNLGVLFFISSIFLFILSLRKKWIFLVATLVLALSTHAYYSERIISLLFLPAFVFLYRDHFLKNKKELFLGLVIFIVVMLPHVFVLTTGALTRRLDEVGYVGKVNLFAYEFIKRYLIYFSPRNLFFDLGVALGRMPPTLGVFYSIFIVPFFIGIKNLKQYSDPKFFKLLLVLIAITPISAALTGDNYYPLRALDLIWFFSIIISVGIFGLIKYFPRNIASAILVLIIIHSLTSFYIAYFVLFKYEKAKNYGNVYISLYKMLDNYKDYNVVIDSARDPGAGLRMAYLTYYDPISLQNQLRSQLKTPYYSKDVQLFETYTINNVKFKAINWRDADCRTKTMFVGDNWSISKPQVEEHNLKYEFEVKDISGYDEMTAYKVNTSKICETLN